MPLVPETKMADVGKLISLGNLLIRKVTWLVLTTTSANLEPTAWQGLLIYTHVFQELILSILTSRDSTHTHTHTHTRTCTHTHTHTHTHMHTHTHTHSLSLSLLHFDFQLSKIIMYTVYNLFLSCSTFSVRLFLASNTALEISSNPVSGILRDVSKV